MNSTIKSITSIVQYTLGLHGILQVKFVKDKRRWMAAMGLLIAILICTGLDVLGDNAVIYRMIVEIVAAMLVFDDKKRNMIVKYLCVFFCMVFIAAPIEFFLVEIYRAFPNTRTYSLLGVLDETLLTIALILITYFLNRKDWWKEYIKKAPLSFYGMGLVLGLCATIFRGFIYMYGEQMPKGVRIVFEIACVGLVEFILLFGIGLILLSKLKEQYQKESLLKSEYMEVSKQYYDSLKENIREIRKIRHDMNAHLDLLWCLLKERKNDEATAYLEAVIAKTKNAHFSMIDVGNTFVNAVLSNESMKMPEDVTFICEGKIPAEIRLKEFEICTILANLVSNAREACERVEHSKKEICLQIKQNKGHLVIVIENPIEWEVDTEHLEGTTTKGNDAEHGYGLRNVREIVLKYQGELSYDVRDGKFVVEMLV